MTAARADLVIVFDLDDTLYLERDFAMSGFAAIDAVCAAEFGLRGLGPACARLFEAGRRGRIFNEALEALAVEGAGVEGVAIEPDRMVPRLVEAYRNHAPDIALAPDADACLAALDPARLGLITDGPARTQQGKIRALGLEPRIAKRICTGAYGEGFGKPHPRAYEEIEAWSGAAPSAHVYVADNAKKDFVTPRARGWRTVRILRPGRVHLVEAPDPDHAAEADIETLAALEPVLAAR